MLAILLLSLNHPVLLLPCVAHADDDGVAAPPAAPADQLQLGVTRPRQSGALLRPVAALVLLRLRGRRGYDGGCMPAPRAADAMTAATLGGGFATQKAAATVRAAGEVEGNNDGGNDDDDKGDDRGAATAAAAAAAAGAAPPDTANSAKINEIGTDNPKVVVGVPLRQWNIVLIFPSAGSRRTFGLPLLIILPGLAAFSGGDSGAERGRMRRTREPEE